jgi:hypothetical protein
LSQPDLRSLPRRTIAALLAIATAVSTVTATAQQLPAAQEPTRSERRDLPGQRYSLFAFDQTHVLTLIGSYKLGRGWQVGARFRLGSGDLYTPSSTGAYDATVGSQLAVAAVPSNGARLPLLEQLDVRVDKAWTFRHFVLSLYFDVQNVYFANNPLGVIYNYDYAQSAYVNGLPIVPIIGVRGDLSP